jgi:hypothetical protein
MIAAKDTPRAVILNERELARIDKEREIYVQNCRVATILTWCMGKINENAIDEAFGGISCILSDTRCSDV